MSVEITNSPNGSVPEEREGCVKDFGEMKSYFPEAVLEKDKKLNFLKQYFRAQLLIEGGRITKAREVFIGLDKKTGWKEFEMENKNLLIIIDMAVRGETNWDKITTRI